jgi:SAM-dependent methyltransferase
LRESFLIANLLGRKTTQIEELLSIHQVKQGNALDLGCGRFPRNPLGADHVTGVDLMKIPPFTTTPNLEYISTLPGHSLPLEDSSFNACTAFDFLEHIPRQSFDAAGLPCNPFIDIMNEIHRILIPGGIFLAVTPAYPSPSAFVDPTHVNTITESTHEYFSGSCHAKQLGYGFNVCFKTIAASWLSVDSQVWDKDPPQLKGAETIPRNFRRSMGKIRRRLIRPDHFIWILQK